MDIPHKEFFDSEPVSQRHEEKGICDSREAEKDIEVNSIFDYFCSRIVFLINAEWKLHL